MAKKINSLCLEVLNRLNDAGVLKDLIVIGSWSIYFYKYYFKSKNYSTYIRTKDIDFLVPIPLRFQKEVNLFEHVDNRLRAYRKPEDKSLAYDGREMLSQEEIDKIVTEMLKKE